LSIVVDGPAEAQTDAVKFGRGDAGLSQKFGHGGEDSPANPLASRRDVHGAAPQLDELTIAATKPKLELGAADFDA
jgi:hypothetical protein